MTNELVPAEVSTAVAKFASPENFAALCTSASYLPRIMLYGATSDACKEGKIGMGHFGLVTDQRIDDLTKEFPCVVIAWRPKAMRFKPSVASYYNPQNPEFQKILAETGGESNSGFGIEFLFWLPDFNTFATYFASNKSARREAPNINSNMHKAIVLKSEYIKTEKYSWFAPKVAKCDAQYQVPQDGLMDIVNKFCNPPESEEETVESTSADSRR